MERRDFLAKTAIGAAGLAVLGASCSQEKKKKQGAPAASSAARGSLPEVRWRMPSSFPKSGNTIYGQAQLFCERLREVTQGGFDIQAYAAGELLPPLDVLDATQQGSTACCHTCSYYFNDRDRTFSLGTGVPFSMTARQFCAWWYKGGGRELLDEFYGNLGVRHFLAGNTGAQMGGWFSKEVNSVADLNGLRMRIAGIAVDILKQFGVQSMQIPIGDVYAAMERGDLDAVEYVNPVEDEQLNLYKIVKNYYYPGWWEPNTCFTIFVNSAAWAKLPPEYQAAFEIVAEECTQLGLSAYDARNPGAMEMFVQNGVQIKPFSGEIMKAAYEASLKMYADESARNPAFKKIYASQRQFQAEANAWFVLAESYLDTFMQARSRSAVQP